MNWIELARSLWAEFVALFKKPDDSPHLQPFARCKEGGDWRTGQANWSGVLPILKSRTYYLECKPTSFADRRELGISPPPTHTFKLFYYSDREEERHRTTVFCCYLNCVIPRSTLQCDWIASELLTKRVAEHIQIVSLKSSVQDPNDPNPLEIEIIENPGDFSLVKIKKDNSTPSVVLLSRTHPERTQAYWQGFLDAELERLKLEEQQRLSSR